MGGLIAAGGRHGHGFGDPGPVDAALWRARPSRRSARGVGSSKTRRERSAAISVRAWLKQHVMKRAAESSHAGERADAHRDRENHEQKLERRRARFAPGDLRGRCPGESHVVTPPARRSTMRPSRSVIRRDARADSAASCVTSTSVVPSRWLSEINSSRTCWPFCVSRLPVGSSASRIGGRTMNARARATRCCSPPESWIG